MKLIYHKQNPSSDTSPFYSEVLEMIQDEKTVDIASPYIGLELLNSIVSKKKWRLITDMEEWFRSQRSQKSRETIFDFIKNNVKNIRFLSGLHAKIILTSKSAMVGSANLTEIGFCKREEMSVSFEYPALTRELRDWYDVLWNEKTTTPNMDEAASFIESNRENFERRDALQAVTQKQFPHHARMVGIFESPDDSQNYSFTQDELRSLDQDEQNLIKAIRKLKLEREHWIQSGCIYPSNKDLPLQQNRVWVDQYFILLRELFLEFNFKEDSLALGMTVEKKTFLMPINVGQRRIICPSGTGQLTLMMPLEFEKVVKNYKNIRYKFGKNGEEKQIRYLQNTHHKKEAFWVNVDLSEEFKLGAEIKKYWEMLVASEVARKIKSGKPSGFRRSHNPAYFKAVMDLDYRKDIGFSF